MQGCPIPHNPIARVQGRYVCCHVAGLSSCTSEAHRVRSCGRSLAFVHLVAFFSLHENFSGRRYAAQDDISELHCVNRLKSKAPGSESLPQEDEELADTWVRPGLGMTVLFEASAQPFRGPSRVGPY